MRVPPDQSETDRDTSAIASSSLRARSSRVTRVSSLEKTGDLAKAKEQLGVYYFLRDDPYQAVDAFRGMVKADPKNVQAPRLVSHAAWAFPS